jgi:hypothetical protein
MIVKLEWTPNVQTVITETRLVFVGAATESREWTYFPEIVWHFFYNP